MASVSLFVFFVFSYLVLLYSAEEDAKSCPRIFRCGKLDWIGLPFSNSSTNPDCGVFIKDCDKNTPTIQLGGERSYEVISISKPNVIRIKDPLLPDRCESLTNLTLPSFPFISLEILTPNRTLFRCNHTLNISPPEKFQNIDCHDYTIYYSSKNDSFPDSSRCSVIQLPISLGDDGLIRPFEFELQVNFSETCWKCHVGGGRCQQRNGTFQCVNAEKAFDAGSRRSRVMILALAISFVGIGVGVLMVVIYCLKRKLSSNKIFYFWKKESLTHQNVEIFLRNFGALSIRRYSYSDIKKMTNFFRDKLGQGGYGGVYKGKLQDGGLVAVKVLKESIGNGEEFINEVASISRTSHVNIVTLKGFCFEGSERALIYEFMPNGSLENFIYKKCPPEADLHLEWETLFKIAVGSARGLEYLHRGCNARILHFDIKPHNILLDENFCPKISDFGLAKICPREESIISLLGARGTAGYIAPEVFCRNFGGVSHKSDVYSYGMMVLEMVGGRKNIDAGADRTSEIFFPHWIYKRLELDEELRLQGLMNEEERENAKKMIIVSLWCIQTDPSNRPAMSRVVDMLEGSLDFLQIPPKPFLSSPSRSPTESSIIIKQHMR